MVIFNFFYGNNIYKRTYKDKNALIIHILLEYSYIINKNLKELYFLYKGKKFSFENKERISKFNNKNIKIIVLNINNPKKNIKLNQMVCPECKELAIINIDEDKLLINNCINKHNLTNIPINEFIDNQCINEIKCNICKNNNLLYNNKFYICSCKQYICPLCAKSQHKTHNMIEYKNQFDKCIEHNNDFISYCHNCNINLCEKCENQHYKHKIILFKERKPSIKKLNDIKNEIKNIERKIYQYKFEIIKLNNLFFNNIKIYINDLDKYIIFYENIYESIDNLNNYESINNLNVYKNPKLMKDIDDFLNDDIKKKYKKLIDINDSKTNEMTIIYKNHENIKLFNELFIQNNRNNCFIVVNNKIYKIYEKYNFNIKEKNLKIKLIEENTIENMSFMFYNCLLLLSVEMSKWNINKVRHLDYMFLGCSSLYNISDISKWDTKNIVSMNSMFVECIKLNPLPDTSKWNRKNIIRERNEMTIIYSKFKRVTTILNKKVPLFGGRFVVKNEDKCTLLIEGKIYNLEKNFYLADDEMELIENYSKPRNLIVILQEKKIISDMSYMFYECNSLLSLPDISEWNTNKVNNMSFMFFKCERLLSLSDISKWNTNNIIDMRYMFYNCSSLLSLPDISIWNTNNVRYMSYMFYYYISLSSLPDISKWNTENIMTKNLKIIEIILVGINEITNMESMFNGCSSLSSLPDISKCNTSKVKNFKRIFQGCSSLLSLPDISKWNTSNVTDMESMFNKCSSLSSLPDISKWNTSNVTNMTSIFRGCSSLLSLPDISKWNTSNVTDMASIFEKCSSLSSLPDISKWNTSNVTDMEGLFLECSSLSSLPDISKWDTSKVTNCKNIFFGCRSLLSLPDLSKWNISRVTDMKGIFFQCSSLSYLPDISYWNTSKVTDFSIMFYRCSSLSSLPDISRWNISKDSDKRNMFDNCSSLSYLPDISKLNISYPNECLALINSH